MFLVQYIQLHTLVCMYDPRMFFFFTPADNNETNLENMFFFSFAV